MKQNGTAFELNDVTCRYGDLKAVDRVSLTVKTGEQLGFIGPSGSGKTTVLRLLNTMRGPDCGTVNVFGQNVANLSVRELRKLRTRIATIPQDFGLVENMSVVQNVVLGKGGGRGTLRSLRNVIFPEKADLLAIHNILERVGIEEKLYEKVHDLSGGQKQRVAIARALFQEPEALIADEPVSSVDPARAEDTVKLLVELSQEKRFTLCVSLHHVELARGWFPRLIGMKQGKVELDGDPKQLSETELEELYRLSSEQMMVDA